MTRNAMLALRQERQFLGDRRADEADYLSLYADTQPGQNVYWNGFGQPPTLTFRAAFDDLAFNRERQRTRDLLKGRFASGNLGWITKEALPLFAALYCKPLTQTSPALWTVRELLERSGPLTIQQIKEETGLAVKEITPILHRLQQAFLVYEDQFDGAWDRGWYPFAEMFPNVHLQQYTRAQALQQLLPRFVYRHVAITCAMARDFYRLPVKELHAALAALVADGTLCETEHGLILRTDLPILSQADLRPFPCVYAIHRNDFLYKSNETALKAMAAALTPKADYDCEPLQYLYIDGAFCGAVLGHFRNGPYDLNDVCCSHPDAQQRKEEILRAIRAVNFGKTPLRFLGQPLL